MKWLRCKKKQRGGERECLFLRHELCSVDMEFFWNATFEESLGKEVWLIWHANVFKNSFVSVQLHATAVTQITQAKKGSLNLFMSYKMNKFRVGIFILFFFLLGFRLVYWVLIRWDYCWSASFLGGLRILYVPETKKQRRLC